MRCFQTRAACSFGSVWIAICLSRNRGATMWKPVLRQHRARASCGGHVLVKVKLVLKDNAKWAYTRSGHTRNILVARICYLRDIDPFCPEPLRLDLIDPNATNYTTCCGLQQGALRAPLMKRRPKVTLGEGSGRQRRPEPSLRISYVFSARKKCGALAERRTTGAYDPHGATNGPTSPEGRSGRPS